MNFETFLKTDSVGLKGAGWLLGKILVGGAFQFLSSNIRVFTRQMKSKGCKINFTEK